MPDTKNWFSKLSNALNGNISYGKHPGEHCVCLDIKTSKTEKKARVFHVYPPTFKSEGVNPPFIPSMHFSVDTFIKEVFVPGEAKLSWDDGTLWLAGEIEGVFIEVFVHYKNPSETPYLIDPHE